MQFIIIMPPEISSNERKYKYPFISSEILAAESTCILDAFFNFQNQN